MANRFIEPKEGHIRQIGLKWYITISIIVLWLVSCSKTLIFSDNLPEKVKYKEIEFVNCNPEISGFLCIKNSDAVDSVLDLKKCQEQNKLLREIINGN